MNANVARFIAGIQFGEFRHFLNMGVVPLLYVRKGDSNGSGPYDGRWGPQEGRRPAIQDRPPYLRVFQPVPSQTGALVTINGEVVALEIFSTEMAYQQFHEDFLESWAACAVLTPPAGHDGEFSDSARDFFRQFSCAQERSYPFRSGGISYQFDGGPVCGSAQVLAGQVVHLSLFRTLKHHASSRISGLFPSLSA